MATLRPHIQANQFEEHFEDSEYVDPKAAQSPGSYQTQEPNSYRAGNLSTTNISGKQPLAGGRPIPLVRVSRDGKLELDEEALNIIAECDAPVGFATFVGKYRIGKSFLINRVLDLNQRGERFRVESSTKACTEGVWMWSVPGFNEKTNSYVFLLDTEGIDSLNRSGNYHARLFTMMVLMSSCLIYNSVGAIDEKSISQLSFIASLSESITIEANATITDNEERLPKFMPKFLWVLRDFTLELAIDSSTRKRVTPKQYLESCLSDQSSRITDQSRTVRRAITRYFRDRDCMTFVRPADEQEDLQQLDTLPSYVLRKEFLENVRILREKIFKGTGPKQYEGNPLYGSDYVTMLESYVEKINSGSVPSIKTAWEHIEDEEGIYAYNKAIDRYNDIYLQQFSNDEPKGEEIHRILSKLRDRTLDQFKTHASQSHESYETKLKNFIAEKQEIIIDTNKQLNERKNFQLLREITKGLVKDIEANKFVGKPDQLTANINEVVKTYNQKAQGQTKAAFISEFLTNMNPVIQKMSKPEPIPRDPDYLKDLQDQKAKTMEKQINSAQNQATLNAQPSKKDPKTGAGQKLPDAKTSAKTAKQNAAQNTCCILM